MSNDVLGATRPDSLTLPATPLALHVVSLLQDLAQHTPDAALKRSLISSGCSILAQVLEQHRSPFSRQPNSPR
jgi:hypothetical protein